MRLKELRIKNNLTQEQIAKILNMTQEKYSRLETGVSKINLDTIIQLANFYNVSLDFLCERQWNNQIGYIQEDRRDTIKQITQLDDNNFELVKVYTQAIYDTKKSNK